MKELKVVLDFQQETTLVVEVFNNVIGFSVVHDYYKRKKYNLKMIQEQVNDIDHALVGDSNKYKTINNKIETQFNSDSDPDSISNVKDTGIQNNAEVEYKTKTKSSYQDFILENHINSQNFTQNLDDNNKTLSIEENDHNKQNGQIEERNFEINKIPKDNHDIKII